jgi:N-glycosylase/DNA lyase
MPPSPKAVVSLASTSWRELRCLRSELRLDIVLKCGQSFRWKKLGDSFIGVLGKRVWMFSQGDEEDYDRIRFKCYPEGKSEADDTAFVRDYFQLDVRLSD